MQTRSYGEIMLKSYPKILPLVGKYFDLIKGQKVEVTEKIDGSAFAFGKDPEGNLYMRSKGAALYPDDRVQDLFRPAVEHVLSIQHLLPFDMVFYAETMKSERHNTLKYDRIPKNHIALYGITDFERTTGEDYGELLYWANKLDVEAVPTYGLVQAESIEQIAEMIDRPSAYGGCQQEGIVLKDYSRPMRYAGMVYPFTVLKFVSEKFKEVHASNPDWTPNKSKLELLLERYKSEARWEKAVQHLKERGEYQGEPRDIDKLMKEIHSDLVTEERENFKEELYQIYQKDWKNVSTRGMPEWFKGDYLLRT